MSIYKLGEYEWMKSPVHTGNPDLAIPGTIDINGSQSVMVASRSGFVIVPKPELKPHSGERLIRSVINEQPKKSGFVEWKDFYGFVRTQRNNALRIHGIVVLGDALYRQLKPVAESMGDRVAVCINADDDALTRSILIIISEDQRTIVGLCNAQIGTAEIITYSKVAHE